MTTQRRGPRDLTPFDWRAELASLGVGLGWIAGIMAVWRLAILVGL